MTNSEGPPFQTGHTLLSFFVAALLRPDAQKLAQKELDTVTGRERLPKFEDRPNLPFVDAICTELMRWRPTTPLGEEHVESSHAEI
jgi:cytochrome P450